MLLFQSNQGDPVAGLVGIVLIIVMFVVGIGMYFLPTIIAIINKHRQTGAIFVLNFLTGWTFIGWVGAIVWAFVNSNPAPVYVVQQPSQPQYYPQPQPQPQPPPMPQNTRPHQDYNYKKFN